MDSQRRRLVLVFAVFGLAALLAACGASGMSGEQGNESPRTGTSGTQVAAPTTSGPAPVEVRVTLTEFGIESSLTTFQVDVPYRFVVTNAGCAAHELMIMEPVNEPTTPAQSYEAYPMGPMYGGRGPMPGPSNHRGAMGGMYCDGSGMPWSAMFPNEIPMSQLDKMALATVEDSDLHPGATATLDMTFHQRNPAGTLEFACHLPGHYEMGMRLAVTVS